MSYAAALGPGSFTLPGRLVAGAQLSQPEDKNVGGLAPLFVHSEVAWDRGDEPESCSCSLPAVALGKVGPAPPLLSTVALVLVEGMQVTCPKGVSVGEP